ncbi:hypothetical protein ACS0TY_022123 [Phlomoides rotata]
MAGDVVEIVDIPDNALDDDEVCVLYSTPSSRGTSKLNAIPVDNYRSRLKSVTIDLTQESSSSSDHVKPKRFYKGESSNSKPPSPLPLIFTCEICVEEKPISDTFRILGCNHSYCTECITKYVASKLQDNITKITCPVSDCEGYIDWQQCRFILPKELLDRWGDALCEAVILGWERFYCPYKDCSALLIDDSEEEAVVQSECPSCNRLFCAACKVPWHTGVSCADFQKLNKDERGNEDLMLLNLAKSNKWMRCPKCRIYVSRIDGCLFMRCRCGHNFCYNCGSPIVGPAHYCSICKH